MTASLVAQACFVTLRVPPGSGDGGEDARDVRTDGADVDGDTSGEDLFSDAEGAADGEGDGEDGGEDGGDPFDAADSADLEAEDAAQEQDVRPDDDEEEEITGPCMDDPGLCGAGEVCRPACFDTATGCGLPPGSAALDCESPVDLPADSSCTVTLDSLEGQERCILCEARVGVVVLDYSDFRDPSGVCGADGWALVSGDGCFASYSAFTCTPEGTAEACCDDLATICADVGGNFALRSDKFTNQGRRAEWRITKTYDTTGVTDLELCLDLGKNGWTTMTDYFFVTLSDSGHSAVAACADGEAIMDAVTYGNDDTFTRLCYGLPPWAGNNPALTVAIALHSGFNHVTLFLDNVSLRGWSGGCPPNAAALFSESFDGCPGTVPDGWNGWQVSGAPACPGFSCPGGSGDSFGAEALGAAWSMERAVDLSAADGDVRLCLDVGESGAGAGESIGVEFSSNGGAAWQTAWSRAGNITPDGQCIRVCVNLSDIDAGVRRNRDVKIRFALASDGAAVDIDDLSVTGAVYCGAGAGVLLGLPAALATPGTYGFPVHDGDPLAHLSALITCAWDDMDPPGTASDDIRFIP